MLSLELANYYSFKNTIKLILVNKYFKNNINIDNFNSEIHQKNLYNNKIRNVKNIKMWYHCDNKQQRWYPCWSKIKNISHLINLKKFIVVLF